MSRSIERMDDANKKEKNGLEYIDNRIRRSFERCYVNLTVKQNVLPDHDE